MQKELFNDFPEVSSKEWKQKIQYDLKGEDYNEKMVWESPEGIKVKPFYHSDDLDHVSLENYQPRNWKISESIRVEDEQLSNATIKKALKSGADSLLITITKESINFEILLDDINLVSTELHFNFDFLSKSYIEKLSNFLIKNKISFHLHIDPITKLAKTGNWFDNQKEDFHNYNSILPSTNLLSIDASTYQNAGANMIQQLAYALAQANEYLNITNPKIIKTTTFKIAVGGNYFFEIAKIKALRKLYAILAHEYGLNIDCQIIATPSLRNKTIYAYNTNISRNTTEYMSAIIGGSDIICTTPHDKIFRKDDDFAKRIALNQLLLLKNESHFNFIEDPTSGAFYIENLTRQLCQKALDLFKQVEASGGFLKQLKTGIIQKKIKESADKEQAKFENGENILVGTNRFINSEDKMKNQLEVFPFVKKNRQKTLIEPIIEKRLSEKVESERLLKEGWKLTNKISH
ncbi:methylmalonyl-CoA mutase subunit beta [Pseudozobellia sp. WGM2]|uniref:methylmalonyl-CoA mutase subunit beta n=1 Tax=Pseudozobellia sp. WGM2 TaxID=2787625 RepID=UPI001ADF995C|nr:methylmalonyl-CoA mutase subunit beta [Pseudozobellia sp. WGM2]